jgi:hypothetical protein
VEKELRSLIKVSVILAIGNEEIKKPILIKISPGRASSAAYHGVRHACATRYIGKCPILIILEKVVRTFADGVAP